MFKKNAMYGAILAASTINLAHAQLEEVIVTATKKSASTQDIPIAITAMGEESLQQLGIKDFSDYLVHLPGVTAGGG
ncbi:MAG: iron complex outermembrane receptor protein, partial [Halieaceae bacterium]